jgi:hypothetical protein
MRSLSFPGLRLLWGVALLLAAVACDESGVTGPGTQPSQVRATEAASLSLSAESPS